MGHVKFGGKTEGGALLLFSVFRAGVWGLALGITNYLGDAGKSLSPSGLRVFICKMKLDFMSEGSSSNKVKMKPLEVGKVACHWVTSVCHGPSSFLLTFPILITAATPDLAPGART